MAEEVDAGEILAQARAPLTADLDAGLVYRLSFQLEAEAFGQAVAALKADYRTAGGPQAAGGSVYRRAARDQAADAARETALVDRDQDPVLRHPRRMGVTLDDADGAYRVFEGGAVTHPQAVQTAVWPGRDSGAVVLEHDGKLLVETPDGLVKLVIYEKLE